MNNQIVKSSPAINEINFFDPQQFETMQRISTMFSNSELVPEMYRTTGTNPKEKAIANCVIAIETAQRIGASPLMVMQNMYIVHGKPSWSAKFLVSTVNSCGRFKSLKYRMVDLGEITHNNEKIHNWQCIAYTSERGSDDIMESIEVSIEMAIKEGWYDKKGSKWKTMPKLMLQYRAATYWTSAYAPELSMGMRTVEEIEDMPETFDVDHIDVTEKVQKEIKENANAQELKFKDPETEKEKSAIENARSENVDTSNPTDPVQPAEPERKRNF